MSLKWLLILLMIAPTLMAQDKTYLNKKGDEIVMGNEFLERVISVSPKDVGTTEIVNKLSGRKYIIKDQVFGLKVVFSGLGPAPTEAQNGENDVILTAKNFDFEGYTTRDLSGGGKELTLKFGFNWEMTEFRLAVNYEIYPGRFSMRKWIEVADSSYGIQFLDRIYVVSMKIDEHAFTHGRFGQPVFDRDIFMGVEYPTVENTLDGSLVRIGYVVGKEIKDRPIVSHTAIFGASPSNVKLRQTFMEYVDGIKVNGTRPYLLYNSWYDLRNPAITKNPAGIMNQGNVLKTVEAFRKDLFDRYHISLNGFVLDDGWDNYHSFWGIDSSRFPEGFTAIVDSLRTMNTSLGMWASPFGGYSNRNARVDWGKAHGYETTGNFYSLAGPRYKAAFMKRMDDYAKKYDLGYFKWDGFLLSSNNPDQGHLPGIYSRETNVSNYIDVMKSVRKINPDIFLNITSGTWLSPWWLKYANCIWMQGEDYGYQESIPSLNDRGKAINYKDVVLWNNFRRLHLLFPMSSLMTHGIIRGRFNELGGENESLSSFSHEVMMYFGRGVMMWELYVTPGMVSPGEWECLASTIEWAKQNRKVLENTKMILGNPLERQVYGYIHMTKEKGILLLRNPDVKNRKVTIRLGPDMGAVDPNKSYYVKIIYPYNMVLPHPVKLNGEFSLDLEGYEILTAELIPAGQIDRNLPVSIRYELKGSRLVVFGRPGRSESVESVGGRRLAELEFGTPQGSLKWKVGSLGRQTGGNFTAHLRVTVPDDYENARIAFLLETDSTLTRSLDSDSHISINGVQRKTQVENGNGKWFWVSSSLDKGANSVDCRIKLKQSVKGSIEFWIISDQRMVERSVKGVAVKDGAGTMPMKPYPAAIRKMITPITHYDLK